MLGLGLGLGSGLGLGLGQIKLRVRGGARLELGLKQQVGEGYRSNSFLLKKNKFVYVSKLWKYPLLCCG